MKLYDQAYIAAQDCFDIQHEIVENSLYPSIARESAIIPCVTLASAGTCN